MIQRNDKGKKGEFMLGLCEQYRGQLKFRQKSIIDRCVRKMYIDIARAGKVYSGNE